VRPREHADRNGGLLFFGAERYQKWCSNFHFSEIKVLLQCDKVAIRVWKSQGQIILLARMLSDQLPKLIRESSFPACCTVVRWRDQCGAVDDYDIHGFLAAPIPAEPKPPADRRATRTPLAPATLLASAVFLDC